eukprot:2811639-Alexandrium_andersonii.AAC.1
MTHSNSPRVSNDADRPGPVQGHNGSHELHPGGRQRRACSPHRELDTISRPSGMREIIFHLT